MTLPGTFGYQTKITILGNTVSQIHKQKNYNLIIFQNVYLFYQERLSVFSVFSQMLFSVLYNAMFGMWFEFMFQRFICWNLDPHCSGNKPV
jgi:hypothetical protein